MQHVSSASEYEGTPQLLILTESKSHIYLLNGGKHHPMKKGRKPGYSEEYPDDELQEIPPTKFRKFSTLPKLELVLCHWWQEPARKEDTRILAPLVLVLWTM